MAGITHSQFVTITYNSQAITCSISSISGIGESYEEADVTTLCDAIMTAIHGRKTVNLDASGPFNTTATTGAHNVVQPLNGDPDGATLTIAIGDNAAPTGGDPEFEVTNMGVFSYIVEASGGTPTASWTWRPLPGAAASWGTV
jgi:hypothetical protein